MTAYTPTTWADEVPGETPVKYVITGDIEGEISASATIELAMAPTPGTPLNATEMNNIDVGIRNAQLKADCPVTHRQGDTGDWGQNYGTTDFDTSAIPQIIQVGCSDVLNSGDLVITFPVAFSAAPIVIATAGVGVSTGVFVTVSYVTTTGCHLSAWSAAAVRANSAYTNWMAIGPA